MRDDRSLDVGRSRLTRTCGVCSQMEGKIRNVSTGQAEKQGAIDAGRRKPLLARCPRAQDSVRKSSYYFIEPMPAALP